MSQARNTSVNAARRFRPVAVPLHRPAGSSERDEGWRQGSLAIAVVLLAMLAWAASIAWSNHQVRAEIAALPPAERATFYSKTIDQLRSVCAQPSGLRQHCIDQAELALKFPECDAACETLASAILEHRRR
jgi:hypothetical protein